MKVFAGFLFILLLLTGSSYVFIPSKLTVSAVAELKAPLGSTYRVLSSETYWKKWWPCETDSKFTCNGSSFSVFRKLPNTIGITIQNQKTATNSGVDFIQLRSDSLLLTWAYTINTSLNPLTRWRQYRQATAHKATMSTLLAALKSFMHDEKKVYGIDIEHTMVKDTMLISTRAAFNRYPSQDEIYKTIQMLYDYAATQNATVTNKPMLHVFKKDSNRYEIMVATPVNKNLKDYQDILFKRMVAGNILVTEVRGGQFTIDRAFEQLQNYIDDNKINSPAIPFDLLITDRNKETDTSKWITRIYYPVY